jgi:hypothetical protein
VESAYEADLRLAGEPVRRRARIITDGARNGVCRQLVPGRAQHLKRLRERFEGIRSREMASGLLRLGLELARHGKKLGGASFDPL